MKTIQAPLSPRAKAREKVDQIAAGLAAANSVAALRAQLVEMVGLVALLLKERD